MYMIISIITLLGLLLNFAGAIMLAKNQIISRRRLLNISRQIVPVISKEGRNTKGLEQAYDEAILRKPDIQYRLRQSNKALIGLIMLTIGFSLQLSGIIISVIHTWYN